MAETFIFGLTESDFWIYSGLTVAAAILGYPIAYWIVQSVRKGK